MQSLLIASSLRQLIKNLNSYQRFHLFTFFQPMSFATVFEIIFTFDEALPVGQKYDTQLFDEFTYTHDTEEITEMQALFVITESLKNCAAIEQEVSEYASLSSLLQHLKMVSICIRDEEESVEAEEMYKRCPWLKNHHSPLGGGKLVLKTHTMEQYNPETGLLEFA